MIKDCIIRKINNEEILYIYLDFNSEFANLNDKKNSKELKTEIKKYLSDNDIDFKGVTVALVVGGIVMGTILLNKPVNSKKYSSLSGGTGNIVSIIDNVEVLNNEVVENIDNTNIVLEENKNESSEIDIENKSKEDKKEILTEVKKEDTKVVESNKNEVKKQTKEVKQEQVEQETVQENVKEDVSVLTYVTLYRSNGSILNIELEEYLIGVVGAEMPASFNVEALKAQAVVARTYTLKSLESGKKLTDNSSTQNYKSITELKNMWGSNYNKYYEKIKSAVESTKGMYLTYNDGYIDAVYHSTSNGRTEDAVNVWGNNVPYLKSVESVYDKSNKSYETTIFMNYDEVSLKLNNVVNNETDFNILGRNDSGRVSEIEINGTTYSGVVFRNLLGLRSADFLIEKNDGGINIVTRGYGHGVGMSQYGANGLANNGYSFKNILLHYYSGAKLHIK